MTSGGVLHAVAAWREHAVARAAFGALVAVFFPQFFLPPAGRIAYGMVFAAVAACMALAALRQARR